MTEEEGTFKVTDRRGRAEEASPTGSPEHAVPRPEVGSTESLGGSAAGSPPGGRGLEGVDLQGIFMMFASSALINMGVAADPVSGERRVDMEQARGAIDALLLLRDKTAGNRTGEEDRFLEQIVYDLQMRFVRAAGPSGS